jgi:hypothetical protein
MAEPDEDEIQCHKNAAAARARSRV